MSGTIFLTSVGFSFNPKIIARLISEAGSIAEKKVAIVTTASEGKESNQFSVLAKNQFLEAGFKTIDFVDLETEQTDFSHYDVIYVCGGNTFTLLKYAKERNFKESISKLLNRGGIYVGVSAGSLIMCPTINQANEVEPDPNEVGLDDLSAFHFVDFDVFPHYHDEIENEIVEFEKKYQIESKRLRDGEAIVINGGGIELIRI